jgi:zinc transport system substrate-binding protein
MSSKLSSLPLILLLSLVLLLPTGCRRTAQDPRPVVVVTIEPYRYFVEQIAGDRVRTVTLVPPGATPETYEPTPRQLTEAGRARALLLVGRLPMEQLLVGRLSEGPTKPIVANVSKGITVVNSINGIPDPHVWMSARNARTITTNICEVLCQIDPAHAKEYRQHSQQFAKRSAAVDARIGRLLFRQRGKAFVVYHPALTYFARDYGLVQLPIEEEGREPSPGQLSNLLTTARRLHVTTVLAQKGTNDRSTSSVAGSLGLKPIPINPLDYNWEKQMMHIAETIANNWQEGTADPISKAKRNAE